MRVSEINGRDCGTLRHVKVLLIAAICSCSWSSSWLDAVNLVGADFFLHMVGHLFSGESRLRVSGCGRFSPRSPRCLLEKDSGMSG